MQTTCGCRWNPSKHYRTFSVSRKGAITHDLEVHRPGDEDSPHSTWRHDRIEALVERGKLTSEQRNIEDRNSLIHYQAELLSARRQPLQDMGKKHSKLRHKVVST